MLDIYIYNLLIQKHNFHNICYVDYFICANCILKLQKSTMYFYFKKKKQTCEGHLHIFLFLFQAQLEIKISSCESRHRLVNIEATLYPYCEPQCQHQIYICFPFYRKLTSQCLVAVGSMIFFLFWGLLAQEDVSHFESLLSQWGDAAWKWQRVICKIVHPGKERCIYGARGC